MPSPRKGPGAPCAGEALGLPLRFSLCPGVPGLRVPPPGAAVDHRAVPVRGRADGFLVRHSQGRGHGLPLPAVGEEGRAHAAALRGGPGTAPAQLHRLARRRRRCRGAAPVQHPAQHVPQERSGCCARPFGWRAGGAAQILPRSCPDPAQTLPKSLPSCSVWSAAAGPCGREALGRCCRLCSRVGEGTCGPEWGIWCSPGLGPSLRPCRAGAEGLSGPFGAEQSRAVGADPSASGAHRVSVLSVPSAFGGLCPSPCRGRNAPVSPSLLQRGGATPAGRWTSVRSASTWTPCRSETLSATRRRPLPPPCPRRCRWVALRPPSPPSPARSSGCCWPQFCPPLLSNPLFPAPHLLRVPSRRAGRAPSAPSSTSPRGRAARCAAQTARTTTWCPAATGPTKRSCGGSSRSRRGSCSTNRYRGPGSGCSPCAPAGQDRSLAGLEGVSWASGSCAVLGSGHKNTGGSKKGLLQPLNRPPVGQAMPAAVHRARRRAVL